MLRTEVENIFDSLRLRERRVLQLRFGLIDGQREQVRSLSRDRPVDTAACLRPGPVITPVAAVKLALKCLAQRHQRLSAELATLDRDLDWLVAAPAPTLCALKGVGTDVAGAVLVAAGDHRSDFARRAHSRISAAWHRYHSSADQDLHGPAHPRGHVQA